MPKMKALRFDHYGPPSALALIDVDRPDAGGEQALVEIHAAAINPSDVRNVAGSFNAMLPRTPGRDFAGVVVSSGTWEGKEVWGSGTGFGVTRDGAHAQYVNVPVAWLAQKPAELSMIQAAAIGVPYIVALTALTQADLVAGETLLITGAAGAVGRAAAQIAHWKGAHVIGIVRPGQEHEADESLDFGETDLAQAVSRLTEGKGVAVALDAVGGGLFEPALNSLSRGGRQVAIAASDDRRVSFDLADFYHELKRLIGIDTMKLEGPQIARLFGVLATGFEHGSLTAPNVRAWKFGDAVAAYEAVDRGGETVKHVLLPRE
jgi:NADPH:quinone reductase-like Zn-dependent oxidoreductase